MSVTPAILEYPELVSVDAAPAYVNLVEVNAGHRVQLPMSLANLNAMFGYNVSVGAMAEPVFKMTTQADFRKAINTAILTVGFDDTDSVTGGLNFSSSIYDEINHTGLREGAASSVNDLVLAYVLYKTFGSSGIKTVGLLTNPAATQGMLLENDFADAIHASLESTEGAAGVVVMFNDLVQTNAARFMTGTLTNPGINGGGGADSALANGAGSWAFVAGDIIDIKVEFTFTHDVTIKTENSLEAPVNKVATDTKFKLRFQLLATAAS